MKRALIITTLGVSFALPGCGDGGPGAEPAASSEAEMGDHGGTAEPDTSMFGRPAEEAMADRTVEVSMLDSFSYAPEEVAVQPDETVAFEVTNEGKMPHEFVLGDAAFQEQHEEEMGSMGGELPPDEPFAISVRPGETKTLAWRFTEAGTFRYACHVPGHYDAGMVGTISVQS